MVKTYGELYSDARHTMLPVEGEHASAVAWRLMEAVTGKDTAYLLARRQLYASEEIVEKVLSFAARHAGGEPLAYILGERDFLGMRLHVTKDVLIPRDDSEVLAQLAIKKALFLPQQPRILDLCTGSGCIGLAVAGRVKDAKVTLGDISQEALRIAHQNCVEAGLSGRVSCVQIDAKKPAAPFLGKFDMIVSNPPYVTAAQMKELDRSVRDFEPELALAGGEDGLDFYRAIVDNFTYALKPGGYLVFEFGIGQCEAVSWILQAADYEIEEVQKDTGDRERTICARKI